jgi:hypothetical protein
MKAFGNILFMINGSWLIRSRQIKKMDWMIMREPVVCLKSYLYKIVLYGISVGNDRPMLAHRASQRIKKIILCGASNKIGNTESWNERISQVRQTG